MFAVPTLAFCHSETRVVVKGRSLVGAALCNVDVAPICSSEIAEYLDCVGPDDLC
jgi:hypothetical protein